MPNPGAHLWYDRPAGPFTEALPVGNGRLGALVFGGITHDKLALNEQSLGRARPRTPTVTTPTRRWRSFAICCSRASPSRRRHW